MVHIHQIPKIMRSLILITLFHFANIYICSAQHTFQGSVLDAQEEAIQHALVLLQSSTDSTYLRSTMSDNNGRFQFDQLSASEYIVKVQMLGFQDTLQQVSIVEDTTRLQITLQTATEIMNELEIVATKSTLKNELGKKVLYVGKDLIDNGNNTLEALEQVPSVVTNGRGEVLIRGEKNVVIYVNGQQTNRTTRSLKFLPLESIGKIEVITNPSAKYDAEGVSGIINIVLLKQKKVTKKLQTSISANTTHDYNIGIHPSFTHPKYSFQANLSLYAVWFQQQQYNQRHHFINDLQFQRFEQVVRGTELAPTYHFDFSYSLDSTSEINANLRGHIWNIKETGVLTQQLRYINQQQNQENTLPNDLTENESEWNVSLSYLKKISPNHQLNIRFLNGREKEDNYQTNEEVAIPELNTAQLKQSHTKEHQNFYLNELDYTGTFNNKIEVEMGLRQDWAKYKISQEQAFFNAPTIQTDYDIHIQKYAAYGLFKHQFAQLETSIGLRYEYYNSRILETQTAASFLYTDSKLFPSVQLQYNLSNDHSLQFNYTKRINRPSFFQLNPFVSYTDAFNVDAGNPLLRPAIGNLFEISYQGMVENIVIDLNLFQRTTTDAIQSVVEQVNEEQTIERYANIQTRTYSGLESSLEYSQSFFKGSLSFMAAQSTFVDQEAAISFPKQFSWRLNLRQKLTLPKDFTFTSSQWYKSPRYEAQAEIRGYWTFNAGLSKKLKQQKGSISLTARDIFDRKQYVYLLKQADMEIEKYSKWQTRSLSLKLVYNLL